MPLSIENTHPSWQPILKQALQQMEPTYVQNLSQNQTWLPGADAVFRAFTQPLTNTRYILFGESPYPRALSANGYAFWDNAVHELWSEQGLSKPVNRATSLRNFIKMLLLAQGLLSVNDLSQQAIANLNKNILIHSLDELFQRLLDEGFLLLNASLVWTKGEVPYHARHWKPFMESVLQQLSQQQHSVELLLFGNIAKAIEAMPSAARFTQLQAEHPYNISFIVNPKILNFFKRFKLLLRR